MPEAPQSVATPLSTLIYRRRTGPIWPGVQGVWLPGESKPDHPTGAFVSAILAGRTHPAQGFRSCLGVLRLGDRYGSERLEAACARALAAGAIGYRSVDSILRNGLDRAPLPSAAPTRPRVDHANVRGATYYR